MASFRDRSCDVTSSQALEQCLQDIIKIVNEKSEGINKSIETLAQGIEELKGETEKLQEEVERKRTS